MGKKTNKHRLQEDPDGRFHSDHITDLQKIEIPDLYLPFGPG
jgi:hypothetical protein